MGLRVEGPGFGVRGLKVFVFRLGLRALMSLNSGFVLLKGYARLGGTARLSLWHMSFCQYSGCQGALRVDIGSLC